MAVLKVTNNDFDMVDADLSGLFTYPNKLLTATEARFFDDPLNSFSLLGSGLTYDPAGIMNGGTVTKIASMEAGINTVVVSNFSADGGELFPAFEANDLRGVWDIILAGNDVIRGDDANDRLTGNTGNDSIYGNGGGDTLFGENGADKLFGGDQNDVLIGGFGNDTLEGGLGNDALFGGRGDDNFVFKQTPGVAHGDFVKDFRPVDDTINLDRGKFAGVGPLGVMGAGKFHIGAAAHDASDRIIYDDVAGILKYDADGNGAGASVDFASISRGLALTNADFVII